MDELTIVDAFLTEERPASAQTVAAARRRLTGEITERSSQSSWQRSRQALWHGLRGRRGLRIAVAAVTAAAVTAMTAGGYQAWRTRPLYHPEPLAGYSGPASDFLLVAADAKARHATQGRLWYVHLDRAWVGVVRSAHEPGVRYRVYVSQGSYEIAATTEHGIHSRIVDEDVASTGWQDPVEQAKIQPVSAADRAAWVRDHKPGVEEIKLVLPERTTPPADNEVADDDPFNKLHPRGPEPNEGGYPDFGITEARRLPTDPAELRAWLLNYATKFDHKRLRNQDIYLFTTAPALLIDRPVSDQVRIAVYRILASLKGVRMVTATDAAGRTRRAVAMRQTTPELGTMEWQLFIDSSTGQLTASQGVVVHPGTENADLPPGTRQFSEVVRTAEWTNKSPDELKPAWLLEDQRFILEQRRLEEQQRQGSPG